MCCRWCQQQFFKYLYDAIILVPRQAWMKNFELGGIIIGLILASGFSIPNPDYYVELYQCGKFKNYWSVYYSLVQFGFGSLFVCTIAVLCISVAYQSKLRKDTVETATDVTRRWRFYICILIMDFTFAIYSLVTIAVNIVVVQEIVLDCKKKLFIDGGVNGTTPSYEETKERMEEELNLAIISIPVWLISVLLMLATIFGAFYTRAESLNSKASNSEVKCSDGNEMKIVPKAQS
eukprot:jgi/Bigna1/128655/aug1.7_g3363